MLLTHDAMVTLIVLTWVDELVEAGFLLKGPFASSKRGKEKAKALLEDGFIITDDKLKEAIHRITPGIEESVYRLIKIKH